ncbi:hypothetical protein SCP_1303880 [Sparassis crispa]|uniref:Uncharacterized protein n=1 Tax=Sparassis crispa TaxID=139825 RepID=A0A401H2B2_9APHY|nr:hypothetical protein SCP_1303880 [Sparassis crispa]GBE88571.1 hypothetical protein SCP_1303880 [Sparassis crispa]
MSFMILNPLQYDDDGSLLPRLGLPDWLAGVLNVDMPKSAVYVEETEDIDAAAMFIILVVLVVLVAVLFSVVVTVFVPVLVSIVILVVVSVVVSVLVPVVLVLIKFIFAIAVETTSGPSRSRRKREASSFESPSVDDESSTSEESEAGPSRPRKYRRKQEDDDDDFIPNWESLGPVAGPSRLAGSTAPRCTTSTRGRRRARRAQTMKRAAVPTSTPEEDEDLREETIGGSVQVWYCLYHDCDWVWRSDGKQHEADRMRHMVTHWLAHERCLRLSRERDTVASRVFINSSSNHDVCISATVSVFIIVLERASSILGRRTPFIQPPVGGRPLSWDGRLVYTTSWEVGDRLGDEDLVQFHRVAIGCGRLLRGTRKMILEVTGLHGHVFRHFVGRARGKFVGRSSCYPPPRRWKLSVCVCPLAKTPQSLSFS